MEAVAGGSGRQQTGMDWHGCEAAQRGQSGIASTVARPLQCVYTSLGTGRRVAGRLQPIYLGFKAYVVLQLSRQTLLPYGSLISFQMEARDRCRFALIRWQQNYVGMAHGPGRAVSLALWASFAAVFCSRNSFASAFTAILASQEVARPGFLREPARVPGTFHPRPDTWRCKR